MPSLVILGMHRSGTSLVAQAAAAAGITAGRAEDMLAVQQDNPEGFFEHRELVEINEALLAARERSWASPAIVDQLDDGLRGRARSLLAYLAQLGEAQFFLKDPRLCLALPAWWPELGEPTLLYVYRDALPVARSLARRNHFPLQLGLLLWEFYNRAALRQLADRDVIRVSYDAVVSDPAVLSSALEMVSARGFRCQAALGAAVVDPSLRHAASDRQDPDYRLLSPEQRALEQQCRAFCGGESLGEVVPMATEALARLQDLSSALQPLATVVETGIARDEAKALSEERTLERDRALAGLAQLEADHVALSEAHEQEQARHRKAARILRGLEQEHEALAVAHRREVEEHQILVKRYEAVREKADHLFLSLTESYRSLLTFETSTLGTLQRRFRSIYRFATRRRGQNSSYEDVLDRAHVHFEEFDLEKPAPPRRKVDMLGDVLRYVLRNPAGSARSFSWQRLRRATQVFFGSSRADLQVWIDSRFPGESTLGASFDPAQLDASLDTLELDFPIVEAPAVSIIVPVYNDYRVTANCLRAIAEHTQDVSYEVIVADDCSDDLTRSIETRVRGIRVSRTPENLRFLRNCKLAAQDARGEFLVFLNNDTEVTAGWLSSLLSVFDDPGVGVVGPKLLFADGRLQEAGGIVWKDGSAWNFGRADDPDRPAYNYRHAVDYVSGACLMIRRDLWDHLGGFDDRFAPAYYEDADLCFAARAAGAKVVYEPGARVFHFEGVSNGTDLEAGVKQHQVTNQQVFFDKWRDTLEAEHFPNGEQVVLARDRSAGRPRILVIDHYVPHYDKDAGGRSTDQYLQLLLKLGCQVQFMGANFFPHQPYTGRLQAMGIEVLVGESVARGLDAWLAEHSPYLDEIWIHRPHVAEQFLPHLQALAKRPTLVFFGHDLHYLRMQREAALSENADLHREAERWRQRELAVCRQVDRVYYFSQAELEELAGQVEPGNLRRLPLYAMAFGELPTYAPTRPLDMLFVGGYNHPPNVDAAAWLAEEILPRVREQVPQARLHLVGSNARERVLGLGGEAVTVHGYLEDAALDALYREIAVAVVPLRYGAGVKGKVIEAIARNVPLITTDIGAEGMPDAESVMWVGNTADELVAQLVATLRGAADLSRMSNYAAWLDTHFSLHTAASRLREDVPALQHAQLT